MKETSKRLLNLISEKNISYGDLSSMTGISKSAIQRYATGETEKIPIDRVVKLAKALGADPKEILGWDSYQPRTKEEKDVEKILDQTREQLMNAEGLMFDGEPASNEAIESILSAMRIGIAMAKEENKKYTPKKYRKD